MDINDLIAALIEYKNGTNPPVDDFNEPDPRDFENEYISMKDYNSSNKRQKEKSGYLQQWNMIYFTKKSFEHLPKFQQLRNSKEIRINITQFVPQKEERMHLKGCHALRVYDMVSSPDKKIINMILNFIFS